MKYQCECDYEWEANRTPTRCPRCGSVRLKEAPGHGLSFPILISLGYLIGYLGAGFFVGFTNIQAFLIPLILVAILIIAQVSKKRTRS